ncbi:MAG: thiol reductant ABC exporter subunit CydD [Chloroflexota bacterium]
MVFDKRLPPLARAARTDLWLTAGLSLWGGLALVGQAFYLSRLINRVFLDGAGLAEVQAELFTLVGLSLIRAGISWAGPITAQRIAGRVKNDLRRRLTAHLLALGPAYTRGEQSGELTSTVVEGVEALDAYFSQYLPQLAAAVLVPLAILAFVLPLDLTSGLVLLLTAPLIPVFMALIGQAAEQLTQRQWTQLSRMSGHFLDVLQGLATLKLLGRSREQIELIARISDRFRQTTMGVLRVAFLSALVLELVATLSTAIVAVEVGLRLLYGYLPFEQALFVLILAPEFYNPLRMLGARFHAGMSGAAAARRIFEVLETTADGGPRTAEQSPGQTSNLQFPGPPPFTIHFKNVYYAYDEGRRPALNDVSFTIRPGQRLALVGPSGAGKSTIAQLLLRFIEPGGGIITVNEQPLAELDLAGWRSHLAWVSQQPYLFNASVADNIRLARPDADPADLRRAAALAQAASFIETLPHGYDTLIGERGARLSGGQAQRLALARAFLKDAAFIILDEATANLDPETEAQIQTAIEQLLAGRTALIIAHRLSTVQTADQILVLNQGRVVETGTHRTLLSQQGLYHRLVTVQ